jgi:hypothetical protein
VSEIVIDGVVLARETEGARQPYAPTEPLFWDAALVVRCGALRLQDGRPLPLMAVRRIGFAVTRRESGGDEEVWDGDARAWTSLDASTTAAPTAELGGASSDPARRSTERAVTPRPSSTAAPCSDGAPRCSNGACRWAAPSMRAWRWRT